MNDDPAVLDLTETFTDKAVPLLVEYCRKFAAALEPLKGLADRSAGTKYYYADRSVLVPAEAVAAGDWYSRVAPAARRLARDVSGMVDQGRISELEKAELQLRLAELEAALETFPKLLAAYREQTK
ncbi:MAG: hypothetical protein K2V38_22890 [Gemmataceae bacterium]|nr:hypothetical protein [Gemmataceae bacterium]